MCEKAGEFPSAFFYSYIEFKMTLSNSLITRIIHLDSRTFVCGKYIPQTNVRELPSYILIFC